MPLFPQNPSRTFFLIAFFLFAIFVSFYVPYYIVNPAISLVLKGIKGMYIDSPNWLACLDVGIAHTCKSLIHNIN